MSSTISDSLNRISIKNLVNHPSTENYLNTVLTKALPPSPTNPIATNFRWDTPPPPQSSLLQMFPQHFPFGNAYLNPVFNGSFTPHQMMQTPAINFRWAITPPQSSLLQMFPQHFPFGNAYLNPAFNGSFTTSPNDANSCATNTNFVTPEYDINKETFDLLIQVFKNIPENGDRKAVAAINFLKKMINNSSYRELINVDNPILKSILNFHDIAKVILSQINSRSHGKKMNESRIQNVSDIKILPVILRLLSSNKSVSVESRLIFSLLYETFDKSILEAKNNLQSIIIQQNTYQEGEVSGLPH
ncbi:MAG: hypothetical protein K1060chlam4_00176 [Candidatus Anoxychlamydiales bacterium]|nr:hypothetical protein [Candidatus Anoxychlamydiales bacterium]